MAQHTYIPIPPPPLATKILLCVDDQSLSACQIFLKQRISRCERYAIVSTLDHEIDVGKHRFHLIETGAVVAEEVGAGEGAEGWEDGSRDERRHGWKGLEIMLHADTGILT